MPVDEQIPYCTKYKMTTKTSLIKEYKCRLYQSEWFAVFFFFNFLFVPLSTESKTGIVFFSVFKFCKWKIQNQQSKTKLILP